MTLRSWTETCGKHSSACVCSWCCEIKRFSYNEDKSCPHQHHHPWDSYLFFVLLNVTNARKDCEYPPREESYYSPIYLAGGAGVWCSDKRHYFQGYLLMLTKQKIGLALYYVESMGFNILNTIIHILYGYNSY